MRSWWSTFRGAFVAGIVALFLVGVQGLAADDQASVAGMERTVQVQGEATITAQPDQAKMTFGVQTEGATAEEALKRNSELMNRVIQALKQAGVPQRDIQTSQLSVYPNMRYPEPDGREAQPTVVSYTAVNQVSLTTHNLNQVSSLVDAAVQAGANQVHGIQFALSDPEAVYEQALTQALALAKRRAEHLSQAAGARLGAIVRLQSGGGNPVVVPYAREAVQMKDASVPIEPGVINIHAEVTATWELRD